MSLEEPTQEEKKNIEELMWVEPKSPKEIIEELIDDFGITSFYPLYSGGQDSGCTVDFMHKEFPEYTEKTVFTCTGIGSPMTREFVIDYANEKGWDLEFTYARKTFYDIVMQVGFRGMGAHRIIQGYLKSQAWYHYMKPKLRRGEKCAWISGVRKKESNMRNKTKFYTKKPIDINATQTFGRPFHYKNGAQLQEYLVTEDIKKSPAYEFFNKSGECWCSCQNHYWELKMLEQHDPFIFNTIKWLESEIQRVGSPVAKKHPHWGQSVGAKATEEQLTLGDFEIMTVDEEIELKNLLRGNMVDYCAESCEVA